MSAPLVRDALPVVAMDPAGPQAAPVETLSWVMFAGGWAILAIVLLFLGVALFGGEWRRRIGNPKLIIAGGIVFPVVTLSALLVWGLGITADLVYAEDRDPLRVRVVGEQWWWRVDYLDPAAPFATANEIVIPVGRPVLLELQAADVIHSFWVPQLAGKLDMIPGKTNRLRLLADRAGAFYGACAEYCGGPHALMRFHVVALPPDEFELWRRNQARAALPPRTPLARRGALLFQNIGCGSCHAVRGTPAVGGVGPDLTHVSARWTLGAGILPNNIGTLEGWIANPQVLKPHIKMPSYSDLSAVELRALANYLDSLE